MCIFVYIIFNFCFILFSDTSRFGYQMLTKMGWESGKGLGAKEDGSTEHIKSAKRRDNLGNGIKEGSSS